ncbi:hypothetical protein C4573_00010 [Candidatus Woesearchaeota archaeon]|nr:MAG: hypothetical protein C4573_00010 [Candidatus Woesearchaeota archaeon]
MKTIIIMFTVFMIITATALELAAIAEKASAKAISFSDDMNNAIDCAIRAEPIEHCSPNLAYNDAYGFKDDLKETQNVIEKTQEQLNNELPEGNETVVILV